MQRNRGTNLAFGVDVHCYPGPSYASGCVRERQKKIVDHSMQSARTYLFRVQASHWETKNCLEGNGWVSLWAKGDDMPLMEHDEYYRFMIDSRITSMKLWFWRYYFLALGPFPTLFCSLPLDSYGVSRIHSDIQPLIPSAVELHSCITRPVRYYPSHVIV